MLQNIKFSLLPSFTLPNRESRTLKRVLLWLTSILVGLYFSSIAIISERSGGNYITIAIGGLMALSCIVYILLFGRIRIDLFVIVIIAFNAWTLVSSIANNFESFKSSAITVGALSLVAYEFFLQGDAERHNSISFSIIGTWAFALVFIIVYRSEIFHLQFSERLGSFFGNENDVGRFLIFSFLLNVYGFVAKRKHPLLCLVFALILFFLTVLTGSISNLLTAAIALLICAMAMFKKRGRIITIVTTAGIIGIVIAALQLPALEYYKNRLLGMLGTFFGSDTGIDYSARNRFLLALDAFRLMFEKPIFGFGFNAGIRNSALGGFAHNNFAEVGACFGVPGLILFNFLILYPIVMVFSKKHRDACLRSNKTFTLLLGFYIFVFQLFLVSYYSKMEYFMLALIYSVAPQKVFLTKTIHLAREKKGTSISWNRVLPIIMSAASSLIGIATSILIARPLGSELYSGVQYQLGLAGTLSVVIQFGINFILIKYSQFEKDPGRYFFKYLCLFHLGGLLTLSVFFGVAYFWLLPLNRNLAIIFFVCLAAYGTALDSLVAGYLLGRRKAAISTLVGSLAPKLILFLLGMGTLLIFGAEKVADNYILFYSIGYLAASLPFAVITLKHVGKFSFTKSEFFSIGSFFMLSLSQSLNSYLSRVIQGQYDFYNTEAMSYTGVLGLILQIMTVAGMFGSVVSNIAAPDFSSLAKTSGTQLFEKYRETVRVNAYICVPFTIALTVEAPKVLSIFGDSYANQAGVIFFVLIGIATMLSNFTGPTGALLTYSGHDRIQIVNGLVYTGLFVLIALLLKDITPFGIPISYLIATIVVETMKYIELALFYKQNPLDLKTILLILVLIAVSLIVFYPLQKIADISDWIITNAFLGIGVILLGFFATPFKNDKKYFTKAT